MITVFLSESQEWIPPTVICPPNQQVTVEGKDQSVIVNYLHAIAEGEGNVTITYSIPSGSTFSVGIYAISVIVTDEAGNVADCEFRVRVSTGKHI